MKTAFILSMILTPFILGSCSTRAGTAVAGAATYKAIDDHKEKEDREDYAKYKHAQNKKKKNNNR